MTAARTPADRGGFTLVELLIVIAILGVLAAVLLPQVFETGEAAKAQATRADLLQLGTGIDTFVRAHGTVPPDDLRSPTERIKANWKNDNGRNTGIESLVCFLSLSARDGLDLSPMAERLVNTDADDHGATMPLLSRRERLEIADHWGTPLVYFSKFGMERPQQVQVAADDTAVQVKPKRRADGTFIGSGKYQLLSAGQDRAFGTDDDIVWPEN